jgi:LacI family transcriptional regulator
LPAKLRDVAEKARVSIKTVSRVVNRQGEISDATRQRVLAAIAELGYRPSKVARALVTQHTDTVGLVLGDISNPFFPEVARGVLDVAEAQGYNVFLCNSDGDLQRETRILESLLDHGVDGVIIFPTFELEPQLRRLAGPDRPVVAVNRFYELPGVSSVMIRSHQGAQLAVEHLIARGHTAIATLSGQSHERARLQRVQGYRDALTAHGLPVREEWIVGGVPMQSRGRQSALALLSHYPEITAIFAYNDLLALGAIEACRALGRRVPEDCAIVGFDDIPLADMVAPALTTIRVNQYDLGRQAMKRLLEMLAQPNQTFAPYWADVELIVRASA